MAFSDWPRSLRVAEYRRESRATLPVRENRNNLPTLMRSLSDDRERVVAK